MSQINILQTWGEDEEKAGDQNGSGVTGGEIWEVWEDKLSFLATQEKGVAKEGS